MRRCRRRRCDFVIVWFVFLSRCKMFSIVCWQFRFWLARSTAVRSVSVYECVWMCVNVCECVWMCVNVCVCGCSQTETIKLSQGCTRTSSSASSAIAVVLRYFLRCWFSFSLISDIAPRTPQPPRVTLATPLPCYACQFIPCYFSHEFRFICRFMWVKVIDSSKSIIDNSTGNAAHSFSVLAFSNLQLATKWTTIDCSYRNYR